MRKLVTAFVMLALGILVSCQEEVGEGPKGMGFDRTSEAIEKYTTVQLQSDLALLDENQRAMLPLLIEAARQMDEVFWLQAYGDRSTLNINLSEQERRLFEINYGPWERTGGNKPFLPGVGPKPEGANFYPHDMTKAEFETAAESNPDLRSIYTLVRRDSDGGLVAIPYSDAFREHHQIAAQKLREAAQLAQAKGLEDYLELRAEALESNEYLASDLAWMDMKDNTLDIVIGPIETYEDQLFGYKAAHEAFVLIKDRQWSERLTKYAALLPELQREMPVEAEFKSETPGSDSDLNAYEVVFYAGECNSGPKPIAINLPNDPRVQLQKGTRRLQLKNAMRAKFEKILLPIARELVDESQQDLVSFDSFFENTMFHEVAHGLGIKNTVSGKGTVREALRDRSSTMEEGKADVLGLYMVNNLREKGHLEDGTIESNYVTSLAGLFRSIRFGATDSHGIANLCRFNFLQERGAVQRDSATGSYRVVPDRMEEATNELSGLILRLQGTGDYDGVEAFIARYGKVGEHLEQDLRRLAELGIPTDVIFDQGMHLLQ